MRIVFSAVIALIFFTASAQDKETLSFPFDSEVSKMECAAFGNFAFVFIKGSVGQLLYKVIDTEKKLIADQGKQAINSFQKIIEVVSDGNRIHVYVETNPPFSTSIYCLSFNRSSGKFESAGELEQGKPKRHLGYFYKDGRFTIFSLGKAPNEVRLMEFHGARLVDDSQYKTIDAELFSYFYPNSFKFISGDRGPSPEESAAKHKLYHYNGKLVGTIDDWQSPGGVNTTVLYFDSVSHTITYTLLYITEPDHCSMLFKEHLYTYSINRENLTLSIFQFNGLKKVKTFTYSKGDSISIIHSDVIKGTENKLDKNLTKQAKEKWSDVKSVNEYLFKELRTDGEPFISISQRSETSLKLQIGAFSAAIQGTMSPSSAPGGVGGGMGGTSSRPESVTFFYTYLYPIGHEFSKLVEQEGDDRAAYKELVSLDKTIRLGASDIVSTPSATWLIYVDKKEDTINLKKF